MKPDKKKNIDSEVSSFSGTNRTDFSLPSSEDGNRFNFRNVVF
jgi:hypothetical protein